MNNLKFKDLNGGNICDQLISLRYESSLYIVSSYYNDNEKDKIIFAIINKHRSEYLSYFYFSLKVFKTNHE